MFYIIINEICFIICIFFNILGQGGQSGLSEAFWGGQSGQDEAFWGGQSGQGGSFWGGQNGQGGAGWGRLGGNNGGGAGWGGLGGNNGGGIFSVFYPSTAPLVNSGSSGKI